MLRKERGVIGIDIFFERIGGREGKKRKERLLEGQFMWSEVRRVVFLSIANTAAAAQGMRWNLERLSVCELEEKKAGKVFAGSATCCSAQDRKSKQRGSSAHRLLGFSTLWNTG